MFVNIIDSYRYVVAICDKELIGKKFEQDNLQLDIKESFYKGEEKTSEETRSIMKSLRIEDATFNIVGKRSIELAIETGIINKDGVKTIADIPFSLVLL